MANTKTTMKHLYILFFAIVTFSAAAQVQVGPIQPYTICQTNYTGTAEFNLEGYKTVVLGSLDPALYSVDYYLFDPNVIAPGTANPALPAYTPSTPSLTIWVKVTEIANPNNYDVAQLMLLVAPQTIANPIPAGFLDMCDFDGINDGFSTTNLTMLDNVIIGLQTPASNYSVSYYQTEADATLDTNRIYRPESYLTSSATLWARISNINYPDGCPTITSFEVIIEYLPEPVIMSTNDLRTSCVDYITGDIYRLVTLFTQYTSANGYTFAWYKDGAPLEYTFERFATAEPGNYTVAVTGPGFLNCQGLPSPSFEVVKSGPPSLIGTGYTVNGNDITVNARGFGNYQYSLSADGPWQDSNIFTNVPGGFNNIYIRDNRDWESCETVVISNVLSANPYTLSGFKYYPNPVATQLHLENSSAINNIALYNTLGQEVLSTTLNDTKATLNVSALSDGVYFAKVQAGNEQKTIRFIKE